MTVFLWEQPYKVQNHTFSKKQPKTSLHKVVNAILNLNWGYNLDIMITR